MYKDNKRYNKNGYVIVNKPEHPKAFDATGDKKPESFCVYEHVLIAEEIIDRPLKEGEVVHHLDEQKDNNSPDNLLVISNPMHGKLHQWLNKHEVIPNEAQEKRIELGCIRCKVCKKPITFGLQFCSTECTNLRQITDNQNSKNTKKTNKRSIRKRNFGNPNDKTW
jgi:predicted nucleic acid-binding Zn ribbon protein